MFFSNFCSYWNCSNYNWSNWNINFKRGKIQFQEIGQIIKINKFNVKFLGVKIMREKLYESNGTF